MALLVRTLLAVVLLVAAATKCRSFTQAATALATFRVPRQLRVPAAVAIVAVETLEAAALIAGARWAPYAGAALFATFAVAAAAALADGKRGAPCACFGARSRVGPFVVARNVALAGAALSIPFLPTGAPSTTGWLAIGLVVAFAGIVALGVAVLALTREVGLLHLRLGPEAALDIADEGPALGTHVEVPGRGDTRLTLAIFSSETCRICQTLTPVIQSFRAAAWLTVTVFDESRDAEVWERLRIPGSPYAVALDRDGEVRAKGTFNSYGQLEGIVATAERAVAA
ncbi:MAG: MauE/DoxX family redox-associated membrane protein [Gaiellaceae bacterium]